MSFKTCVLIGLIAVLPATPGRAQATATLTDPATGTPANENPVTISLLLGTSGAGAGVRLSLQERWNLHAGLTWLPFNFGIPGTIGDRKIESRFDNAIGAVHLLADYSPFLKKKGFRISAGLAYFFAMRSSIVLSPKGGYDFGDLKIKEEEIGQITAKVSRAGLAPYLGIGLLQLYGSNRFNVSFDLGTYYLAGDLNVKIEDSGYLSGNERNEAVLKENLKNYRWLPVLQVAFNYRLKL
jgi:hypothetical protein